MLFRLERNPDFDDSGGCLGYQWIEVLAFYPWGIYPMKDHEGCWDIRCSAVCRTEHGLTQLGAGDIFDAEEAGEYRLVGNAT